MVVVVVVVVVAAAAAAAVVVVVVMVMVMVMVVVVVVPCTTRTQWVTRVVGTNTVAFASSHHRLLRRRVHRRRFCM